MISKSILSFGFRHLKEYQPAAFEKPPVPVFRIWNSMDWVDCKVFHVLYEPMLVLIQFDNDTDFSVFKNCSIRIYDYKYPKKFTSELTVSLLNSINEDNKVLCFFEVGDASLNLSSLKKIYLKRIYNFSRKGPNFMSVYNFSIYRKLVALFSFPKQVRIISIKLAGKNHHFPIDLCGFAGNTVVIGVRNSNQKMNTLEIGDTFYLSEANAVDYDQIYALGKFSDCENQATTIETKDMSFPDVISSYQKLRLQQKLLFENQTLYIAKSTETVTLNDKKPLFHLHKIWLMDGKNFIKVDQYPKK